jgi:cobaltochelatase CobS
MVLSTDGAMAMVKQINSSKFSGKCAICGGRFSKGDPIWWNTENKKAGHPFCAQPEEEPAMETPTPEPQAPQVNGDLMAQFAKAIQPFIGSSEDLKAEVLDMVEQRLACVETVEHVFKVEQRDGTILQLEGKQHRLFDMLLKLLLNGEHVYLYGDPGSGKSTAAIKAAEALGMKHGYISLTPMTPESRLFGYMNGMTGEYVSTEFYRLYRDGGVFCIDEMDNGSSSLLVALNSALENGSCAFPCGMVKKHADFILVATGNTVGLGANRMFPNRQPMDGAFRERFLFCEWNTDESLERHIALQFNPKAASWVDWVQRLRAYAKQHYPMLLVTQRASIKGSKLLANGFDPSVAANMTVFKGFDADSVKAIVANNPLPGEVA